MRYYLFILTLLHFTQASAGCPLNAKIIEHLKTIDKRLSEGSVEPISIDGKDYVAYYGQDGKGVHALLKGDFEGYILDRYKEIVPGLCHYGVRDDRTPARGTFVLQEVTKEDM